MQSKTEIAEPLAYRVSNALFVRDFESVVKRLVEGPTRKVLGKEI